MYFKQTRKQCFNIIVNVYENLDPEPPKSIFKTPLQESPQNKTDVLKGETLIHPVTLDQCKCGKHGGQLSVCKSETHMGISACLLDT